MERTHPKTYVFYSYKGGSGRSTTALNTINHLIKEIGASPEHPILLVDADLESAGATYFFGFENKFSDYFSTSIHTARAFSEGALYDSILFKNFIVPDTNTEEIPDKILSKIAENQTSKGEDPTEQKELYGKLFSGVRLAEADRLNLLKIVSCDGNNPITKIYDLSSLLTNLDNCGDNAEQKTKVILDFLPATGFIDISDHFENCEPGTVKFLGADVRYEGERVGRITADNISKMIKDCGLHGGYSAIVFDSGAGVQSVPDSLHAQNPDVFIYCMRPSTQFIRGTKMQLMNYSYQLQENVGKRDENEGGKNVILLPTAVPLHDEGSELQVNAFASIEKICSHFAEIKIIEPYFCTYETALNEVNLFKWKECVLTEKTALKEDESRAYETYKKLAEIMVGLSGKNFVVKQK